MNSKIEHIANRAGEKLAMGPAKKALGIIWCTGIACVAVVLVFVLKPAAAGHGRFNLLSINRNESEEVRSIDQLLLTSEEALLADKKSFVNGALRFQWRNQEPDLNQGNNRIILYDNILKKKLQRLPRSQVSDFSVRPVPK